MGVQDYIRGWGIDTPCQLGHRFKAEVFVESHYRFAVTLATSGPISQLSTEGQRRLKLWGIPDGMLLPHQHLLGTAETDCRRSNHFGKEFGAGMGDKGKKDKDKGVKQKQLAKDTKKAEKKRKQGKE